MKAGITENELIVNVADVFDEKVMVGKYLFEVSGPICSLMETPMRQSAGDSGLPIGLPLRCRMQRWPNAKVCIFNAVVRRDGTSLMTIFRVPLSRRNVRPLMRSPGLLVFPG